MPISVSTLRILYFLNMDTCPGRFLVRCPLVFMGVQGWQKYLMRSFSSESFCFSKPRTAPTPSKESGSPIVAAQIIEQRQLSGSRYSPFGYPKKRERQMRSKAVLNAHLMTDSSSKARRTYFGICSPQARSITCTAGCLRIPMLTFYVKEDSMDEPEEISMEELTAYDRNLGIGDQVIIGPDETLFPLDMAENLGMFDEIDPLSQISETDPRQWQMEWMDNYMDALEELEDSTTRE